MWSNIWRVRIFLLLFLFIYNNKEIMYNKYKNWSSVLLMRLLKCFRKSRTKRAFFNGRHVPATLVELYFILKDYRFVWIVSDLRFFDLYFFILYQKLLNIVNDHWPVSKKRKKIISILPCTDFFLLLYSHIFEFFF